jgi:transcriptional regulator with XRE-family HTH domain
MHSAVGAAIKMLRLRSGWSQMRLATELAEKTGRKQRTEQVETLRVMISRWETGGGTPLARYRVALARLAETSGSGDLVPVFQGDIKCWRLVVAVMELKRSGGEG